MDLTYYPGFYLKQNVSETVFCLCLQVEASQLGTVDIATLRLRTPPTIAIGVIKPTQRTKPIDVIASVRKQRLTQLFGSTERFHLKMERESSVRNIAF
jgi:hypothetical protein